jgi:hypothetical protein
MKSHGLLLRLVIAVTLAWSATAAEAQNPEKMPRVGWLANNSLTFPAYEGFHEGLRELGYIEGNSSAFPAHHRLGFATTFRRRRV